MPLHNVNEGDETLHRPVVDRFLGESDEKKQNFDLSTRVCSGCDFPRILRDVSSRTPHE